LDEVVHAKEATNAVTNLKRILSIIY